MKILSAQEARERFDGNVSVKNPVTIARILEDIMARISHACSLNDHLCDSIRVSLRIFGNGSSEYSIHYPKTLIERFKYNWYEGYLWVQLTKAEENEIMGTLEDNGYTLSIGSEGPTYRNIDVSW